MVIRRMKHAYILDFPYAESFLGARLENLVVETHDERRDLLLEYSELRLTDPLELVRCEGKLCERVRGEYIPRRLCFRDLRWIEKKDQFAHLGDLSLDHEFRSLQAMLYWSIPDGDDRYLLFHGSKELEFLMFSSLKCEMELRQGLAEAVDTIRDWSPTPPLVPGLVPEPKKLHLQYGGDPVTIRMGGHRYPRRLFVGGLENQGAQRPQVDAVLNLSEAPSRWVVEGQTYPMDRWAERGEGSSGMSVGEIEEEAQWVLERLRRGQSVLVHCTAGLNRSTTVCCAVLILLESLNAGTALGRVREHHPWARPDSHHWLALKWIAKLNAEEYAWGKLLRNS